MRGLEAEAFGFGVCQSIRRDVPKTVTQAWRSLRKSCEEMSIIESEERRAPKPVRIALKALRRQFERCSRLYPPIYHELFEPWWDLDLSGSTVEAVYQSFGDTHTEAFHNQWQEWHGPADIAYFGRFYGSDGRGLDEFRKLAESAYLVLRDIDPSLPEHGYHGWVRMLHTMAHGHPTPLLRSDFDVWRLEGLATDSELEKSGTAEDGVRYPLHPFYWALVHDIFASSIAAIDLILDDESGLLVGPFIAEFPISFSTRTESSWSEEPGSETAEQPEEVLDEPAVLGPILEFRFDGMWHLQFDAGDHVETATLPDEPGLRVYKFLLDRPNPDKFFSPLTLLKETRQIKTSVESNGKADDVIGSLGLTALRGQIELLKHEIDDTVNSERKAELEEELEGLLATKRSSVNPFGRPRKLGRPRVDSTIHAQLKRARDHMQERMPEFVQYLKNTISANGGDFAYHP